MSESEQDGPVMAGSDDAGNDEKLSGLIEQVEHDHGDEGAGAMAEALRDRADETDTDIASDSDAEPGSTEDSRTAQV
ncbi:hypothetical protein [Rathayibacter iranicus]|uniref:Uncharacterized protein n=2 Tax=Rathayibacter iranicus TaxID=59737 RepID=A0AAD1ADW7_9MICO|nr:hypothetical protein [Rathayibacter iranicus]AZZ56363.1 hypothetical protein C7V51_11075 [Rathayibacter iranicus]MWV32193.1 hypothetical protein [Rathayibacter iranicus NCPPB 2253 = VKM Ac-1602]PPI45566.1 hypothetical protein C5E09_10060 [Rathayibacter iranicus]PPI59386.1 hypothetical protein C5E08_10985 [Rathayibacter iranicus]PPI70468.1 hypothetical protein C5E01_10030 [Rathayibacter iranicus]